VCQKARIIVHEPNLANSAPSESSHGGTNTTRSMFRKPGGELDVMQVQRVLEKNAELELVVSCPNLVIWRRKLTIRDGGCDCPDDQERFLCEIPRNTDDPLIHLPRSLDLHSFTFHVIAFIPVPSILYLYQPCINLFSNESVLSTFTQFSSLRAEAVIHQDITTYFEI
jgi:hypothetical protein